MEGLVEHFPKILSSEEKSRHRHTRVLLNKIRERQACCVEHQQSGASVQRQFSCSFLVVLFLVVPACNANSVAPS